MSEAVAAIAAAAGMSPGAARPQLPGELSPRPVPSVPSSAAEGLPETRAASRQALATESRFRIRIQAETMRLITEVVDTVSGDVLFYLPPGYRPDARNDPPTGRGAGDSRDKS
jgi:hypothetical protein